MEQILLVEDDKLMDRIVSNIICNARYHIFRAQTIKEASIYLGESLPE